MGDPAGVGPEIVLRMLTDRSVADNCQLTIFGDSTVLARCAAVTGQTFQTAHRSLQHFLENQEPPAGHLVVDCNAIAPDGFEPGQVSAATGDASYVYIQRAIDAALAGRIAAVATAPISKEALHAAGHYYPGHTEMFAERAGSSRTCMMQYSPRSPALS